MAIFNSYVSLPEGSYDHPNMLINQPGFWVGAAVLQKIVVAREPPV